MLTSYNNYLFLDALIQELLSFLLSYDTGRLLPKIIVYITRKSFISEERSDHLS